MAFFFPRPVEKIWGFDEGFFSLSNSLLSCVPGPLRVEERLDKMVLLLPNSTHLVMFAQLHSQLVQEQTETEIIKCLGT